MGPRWCVSQGPVISIFWRSTIKWKYISMQEYENFRDTIQKMRKKITYQLYKVISFHMKNRKCFFLTFVYVDQASCLQWSSCLLCILQFIISKCAYSQKAKKKEKQNKTNKQKNCPLRYSSRCNHQYKVSLLNYTYSLLSQEVNTYLLQWYR